jgi:glutamate synthase (NADPH/NADH) large chain
VQDPGSRSALPLGVGYAWGPASTKHQGSTPRGSMRPGSASGLYDPAFEHDSCGVGFVVNISGERSHQVITDGITVLHNLIHRGAVGGDLETGDGAGILSQLPHAFFTSQASGCGFRLPPEGSYGVAQLFLPLGEEPRARAQRLVEKAVTAEGATLLGWRAVPVQPDCLGEQARSSMPYVAQLFVTFAGLSGLELERRLYVARKRAEAAAVRAGYGIDELYIVSFSSRTITYKGMFVAPQLDGFYPDLLAARFTSAIALVHQRYSTNTFPSWPLAQPYRCIAHNGEINTLRGNINKMRAREALLSSELFGAELEKLKPIINTELSDSGIFDNVFELLAMTGRSVEHAMMMMIPEAFGPRFHISEDKRAFYEYHAAIMEPWDGPAAIAFTDGTKVGAVLDRNGLRPARYVVTKSGRVVMASETGVLDIPSQDVLEKGRLGPGKMLLVDTAQGRIRYDNEIKASVSRRKPYRRWLESHRIELRGLVGAPGNVRAEPERLVVRQRAFGYTREEKTMVLAPMAANGQEPLGSMGNDAALAVLSDRPQLLYNYFKQLFAQVTNPPIDPYRENLVMSLMSFIGREGNLLGESAVHCRQLRLAHPILSNDDLEKLLRPGNAQLSAATVPMFFATSDQQQSLAQALDELCRDAEAAVDQGHTLVMLSDRGVNETKVPIPALLGTSAVHHYLIRRRKRQLVGLIVETAEARDVMHFAILVGYGASAVNPYLALETLAELHSEGWLGAELKLETAVENYITAVKRGLLKIMSKMGVSTVRSYRGAQLFEAVGLAPDLIECYFPGTPSRIGGIGLEAIAREARLRHQGAFSATGAPEPIDSGGVIHFRSFGERHLWTPECITRLQSAARECSYEQFKQFTAAADEAARNLCTLRGLLSFRPRQPVPLEQVEPAEAIVRRFVASAMSFGSISQEAHEAIAIGMNRVGAWSNSGEGGEEEERYTPRPNGDNANSRVKQVASGRFGVTNSYLASADELQIKMAQGAKPGEGGQLPGHKVDAIIAKVRHSMPGVGLISPPPHHDIYSIEDLAQLIFDLKNANRRARVSVKLVAEVGVGTVAAGVAKAKADMVLISGHDGGTGSSPLSSIMYAGIPWEIGLAETQQTLVLNRLRDRIRLQVDGKLRTGRDVVVGALLGAEEFGFATAVLVTLGCVMMRKCHLNTCPVGVATQDPELRQHFRGDPQHVANYAMFLAREVRELMAQLGFVSLDEMVGRVDVLEVDEAVSHWKARGLDLSRILAKPDVPDDAPSCCVGAQQHDSSLSLDPGLIDKAGPALAQQRRVSLFAAIRNCHRTVGATLSSEVARRYGSQGLADDTIVCKFSGSAGQSFGAFLARGITLELEGDANDYLGKGLSGGRIILYPPKDSTFRAHTNIITGNVNLFGATGGEVFINGGAGERFAVRNSGALAVVECVGDHGCEYMTGGVVVVLGPTGVNFAAGMSGGIAYVLDESQLFDTRCNLETVDIEPVSSQQDRQQLQVLVQRHLSYTGSDRAASLLRDWQEFLPLFVKVMPIDYRRALERAALGSYDQADFVAMTEEVYR